MVVKMNGRLCKPIAALLSAVMLMSCFGCGNSGGQGKGKTVETDKSITDLMAGMRQGGAVEIEKQPDITDSEEENGMSGLDMDEFCVGATDFAITLLRENVQTTEGNVLVSPVSLLNVLAMTANGAGADTRGQMLSVLACSEDIEGLNRDMKAWMAKLGNAENVRMQIANSVWLHGDAEHLTVEGSFLRQNAMYYDADIYHAPLTQNTASVMNRWVSDKTDGEINNIIEELSEDAVMTLINTVTFDARWKRAYDEYDVYDRVFINALGEKENVSMMFAAEYQYIEDENVVGFVKPYQDSCSFVAILPNEGITPADYLQILDGEHFLALLADTALDENTVLETCVPKFRAEYNIELSPILKNMGMTDAFNTLKADFSGIGNMDNGQNLYINTVMHKTYIAVDELGTKARAASADGFCATSDEAAWEAIYVYLNRPFIYAIIDTQTNIPIFIGVINSVLD